MLVPSYGNSVSDIWLTTWDTTNINIQQMLVGRIPANNNEEIYSYLAKHQIYTQRSYDEWNKNFLLFSGGFPDDPLELEQILVAGIWIGEPGIELDFRSWEILGNAKVSHGGLLFRWF